MKVESVKRVEVRRFELLLKEPKSLVLPLYYTSIYFGVVNRKSYTLEYPR